MALHKKYNLKNPGVKRLMREACELAEPTEEYHASPLEDNIFEWHFTVKGPPSTEFEGGYYHGRILLPSQYPMQPPNIILLTPNGRFEVNKKICLSISGHHPESWQPSWSIRTALLALIAFMPIPSSGTIGSLDYTPEERRILANKSKTWQCPICGKIADKLSDAKKPELTSEESDLIKQIALKAEEEMLKKTQESENSEELKELDELIANELRRRNVNPNELSHQGEVINENSSKEDCSNSKNNNVWNAVIGILISAILLLIIRRIFFL